MKQITSCYRQLWHLSATKCITHYCGWLRMTKLFLLRQMIHPSSCDSQSHIVRQTLESQSNSYLPTRSGYIAAAFREAMPPKDAPTTA